MTRYSMEHGMDGYEEFPEDLEDDDSWDEDGYAHGMDPRRSDFYINETALGDDGLVYLNIRCRSSVHSFGPFEEGEDPYIPYYRIITSDGPLELLDRNGKPVRIDASWIHDGSVGGPLDWMSEKTVLTLNGL